MNLLAPSRPRIGDQVSVATFADGVVVVTVEFVRPDGVICDGLDGVWGWDRVELPLVGLDLAGK